MAMNQNTITALSENDYNGILDKAYKALIAAAENKAAAEKAVKIVAVHAVNRLLLDKQLDRLQSAVTTLSKIPSGYDMLRNIVSLYAGGFRLEKGAYIDIRAEKEYLPIVVFDKKAASVSWKLPPKSAAGKASIADAKKQWEKIRDKATGISFTIPKKEKVITYKDAVKTLKRLLDREKWSVLDRPALEKLLSGIQIED